MSDDKVDIWMPLYIGDYLGSTSRLTTELHGAYLLLIMDYWKNGPPPDNDLILASITKMSPDAWSIARAVLETYFEIEDGKWVHGRIDKEKEASLQKKTVAKQKAKAAAEARWGKKNNATSIAQAVHKDVLEECPSPSSSPSHKKNKNTSSDYPDGFDEFWEKYPKKKSKGDAVKAWKKLKPNQELREKILSAIVNQVANEHSWKRDGGQFIPYPASWLNQCRWEDEVDSSNSNLSVIAKYSGEN